MIVYPLTGLVLFAVIGWASAAHFRLLARQIDRFQPAVDGLGCCFEDQLLTWKRQYVAVYDSVNLFNDSFGSYLLVKIGYIFTSITHRAFYLLSLSINSRQTNYSVLLNLLGDLLGFGVMCCTADRIIESVRSTSSFADDRE